MILPLTDTVINSPRMRSPVQQSTTQQMLEQASGQPSAADSTVASEPFFQWPEVFDASELALSGVRVLVLIIGTYLLIKLIDRLARKWTDKFSDLPQGTPRRQRATTGGALISSFARYGLWPLVLVMVLSEFGFNLGALVATAGIAGLALGFGAQTLIKDVIAGFFLLFDDTVHVGDVLRVNGQTGIIEDIGIRLIKMRKLDGELVMIPAGELRVFGNLSIEFVRVATEIDVSYEQDIDLLTRSLTDVAAEWAEAHSHVILDDAPEVHSIVRMTDSTIKLRVVARVLPGEQWEAERNLLRLVKQRFDEQGIEFPFPRRTVYVRNEPDYPGKAE